MITLADFKDQKFMRADTGAAVEVREETEREFIVCDSGEIRYVPKSHFIELYRTGAILPLDKVNDPGHNPRIK